MRISAILLFSTLSFIVSEAYAQKRMADSKPIKITYIGKDFSLANIDEPVWKRASVAKITTYWSGEKAPKGREFEARLLWSDTALYVRFDASQSEPLVVSEKADITRKIVGLWERDVCEIFIAPDKNKPNKYFEFEIAPNGEWIDLGIDVTPKERKTDWDYKSGMTSATKIEKDKVVMAIKVPFVSLGRTPKAGDVWLGNLFRCVGKDPTRGYLAWQPTKTPQPNFHVPDKFSEFHFVK